MASREYRIRGGRSVIASSDIVEMNPEVPIHLKCSANAIWVTEGRFSNTGIVSDGYREGIGGVFLWYSETVNFEAAAVREEGEYFQMMEKFLSMANLDGEGAYEMGVKDLSKSPIKKGIVKRLDYMPSQGEDLDLLVIEEEGE